MTIPAIVVVEERTILGTSVTDYLYQSTALLEPYGVSTSIQLLASMRALRKWIDGQPAHTVRLLLLGVSVSGGTSMAILRHVRDSTAGRAHPALHPDALLIGWSANAEDAPVFHAMRANGFISKHRPVPQIAADIVTVVEHYQRGNSWIALLP